jgi:uncharacterized integral membrane protein (TIGR00697 family)
MIFENKRNFIYVILAGFFITNAIVAELIGGKLIQIGPFTMSIGIIPWPVVFLTTDLINEYYGKAGVRKLSFLTAGLIVYAFILLFVGMSISAVGFSPVSDKAFQEVFGQSMFIIIGSLIAFVVSQLIDVFVFWMLRERTGKKMIWLRATGSTAVSQLIDTFIVLGIAFYLPGKITLSQFFNLALTGYTCKLLIGILLTPFIYLGHHLIGKYLGKKEAEKEMIEAAEKSMHHPVQD